MALGSARARTRNRDRRAHGIVGRLAMRDDACSARRRRPAERGRSAPSRRGLWQFHPKGRATQETRAQAHRHERDGAGFHEDAAIHRPPTVAGIPGRRGRARRHARVPVGVVCLPRDVTAVGARHHVATAAVKAAITSPVGSPHRSPSRDHLLAWMRRRPSGRWSWRRGGMVAGQSTRACPARQSAAQEVVTTPSTCRRAGRTAALGRPAS